MIPKIYTNPVGILIFFGSLWLRQIYKNAALGARGVPNMKYAIVVTAHLTFIPLYLNLVDGNIIFFKPNYIVALALMLSLAFQFSVLSI